MRSLSAPQLFDFRLALVWKAPQPVSVPNVVSEGQTHCMICGGNLGVGPGGTPPAPTDPLHQILVFQVKIATGCGRAMQDVSAEMSRVKDDREQFVKDKAVDLDGEAVH